MYDRRVEEKTLTFGVSGRLYQSNVLFYDHQTESLWSQIKEEAVTGPLTGTRLHALPSVTTTWKTWRVEHPQTLVLSTATGYRRNYELNPYAGYLSSPRVMFPGKTEDTRLHPKEKVIGVKIGTEARAYPLAELEVRTGALTDTVGGKRMKILYDAGAQSAQVRDAATDELIPSVVSFWFAWSTFHPDTAVYRKGAKSD